VPSDGSIATADIDEMEEEGHDPDWVASLRAKKAAKVPLPDDAYDDSSLGSLDTTDEKAAKVPIPDDAYDDSSLGSLDTTDNTEYTQEYIDALSDEEDKQLLLKFNRQIRKKRAKDALFFYGDDDLEKTSEKDAASETSEDEMVDESCFICGKDDDHELFFCYECDAPYHTFCWKLKSVPEGEWYCPVCDADAGTEAVDEPPPGAESKEAKEELNKILSGKDVGADGFKKLNPDDYAFIGALSASIKQDEYFLPRGVTSIVTPEGYIDERIIADVRKRSAAALGVNDPAATTPTVTRQMEPGGSPASGEQQQAGSLVLPSYIEQQGEGEKKNLYVNLDKMDTETRVRCEVIMSAYSNYTHYQKITNPFTCLADMMGVDKVEIAVAIKKEDIAAWDWRTDFPKVPDADGLQTKLLKALFVAIRTGKSREELVRQKQLPELKGWRPFIRLWRQGRQLYSDMQHMFPDLSKQELEDKLVKAFADTNTKPDVDKTVESFARQFRKDKLATERAMSFLEESATGEQVTQEEKMKAVELAAAQKPAAAPESAQPAAAPESAQPAAAAQQKPAAGKPAAHTRVLPIRTCKRATAASPEQAPTPSPEPAKKKPKKAPAPPAVAPAVAPATSVAAKAKAKAPAAVSTSAASAPVSAPHQPSSATSTRRTNKHYATKRKSIVLNFAGTAKKPKMVGAMAKGKVPPKLAEDGQEYLPPSKEWKEDALFRLAQLKHLANCCAIKGIVGPRALMDTAVDEIMGGGGTYDRPFIVLLTAIIVDNMEEEDDAFYKILRSLKEADLLTPQAIANSTAAKLKKIVGQHDKSLSTAWLVKLCKELVTKHDGKVPEKIDDLLSLSGTVSQINASIANTVCQEAYGRFIGPVVDYYYGTRMAIALDLVDVAEYHYDKDKIDANKVEPTAIQSSLLEWLPPQEWRDFHKLMVSTAQLIVEPASQDQPAAIKTIIRHNFTPNNRAVVNEMVASITEFFGVITVANKK
jgi:endonuclease III